MPQRRDAVGAGFAREVGSGFLHGRAGDGTDLGAAGVGHLVDWDLRLT